jgi:uncharacterized protein YqeY
MNFLKRLPYKRIIKQTSIRFKTGGNDLKDVEKKNMEVLKDFMPKYEDTNPLGENEEDFFGNWSEEDLLKLKQEFEKNYQDYQKK